jgi:ABC-type phosphate transport system substrate-binding protein
VNYASSSSGAGRQQFKDGVFDFAVSDIRYNKFDGSGPAFGGCFAPDSITGCGFIYVPITAGGIAIMYHLSGVSGHPRPGFGLNNAPINLSSYTICGIFTGGIPYWDDPLIKKENPGRALPHVAITPVVRSDPAGTNFVLEEYCIATQPRMYFAFADAATRATGTDYPHEPTSSWPIVRPILGADGSDNAASNVAGPNNDGYVTAVETAYAIQRNTPVAAVKNGTGHYVLPTEANVGSALSYATQRSDGTHVLNFNPPAANAYNPSTYSYLLAHTIGRSAAIGASITEFANYCLTIGQTEAGRLRYASIGRNLSLYGLNSLKKIPGYVAPTAAEVAAIPAVDTFNTRTARVSGSSSRVTSSSTTGTTVGAVSLPGSLTSVQSSGVDPGAALNSVSTAHTGLGHGQIALLGLFLLVSGDVTRRRLARDKRRRA